MENETLNNPLEGLTEDQLKVITETMAPKSQLEEAIKRAKEAEALNSKLVLDGAQYNDETNQPLAITEEQAQQLWKETINPDCSLSDIQIAKNIMDLRDYYIETKNEDILVPNSRMYENTQQDYDTAQRVSDIIKECIEYADGDNQLFVQEISRRMPNDSPVKAVVRRK